MSVELLVFWMFSEVRGNSLGNRRGFPRTPMVFIVPRIYATSTAVDDRGILSNLLRLEVRGSPRNSR